MHVICKLTGKTENFEQFLKRSKNEDFHTSIKSLAEEGAIALASNTPVKTGETAASWGYKIQISKEFTRIYWTNDKMSGDNKTPVVILLQYGHGTKKGGFVRGRDFINPAIKPIMDKIIDKIWKEVTRR